MNNDELFEAFSKYVDTWIADYEKNVNEYSSWAASSELYDEMQFRRCVILKVRSLEERIDHLSHKD